MDRQEEELRRMAKSARNHGSTSEGGNLALWAIDEIDRLRERLGCDVQDEPEDRYVIVPHVRGMSVIGVFGSPDDAEGFASHHYAGQVPYTVRQLEGPREDDA